MDGYYKNQEETDKTIINGWLCTGDEGEIDEKGFLKITGRVKDLFKTSKGKYVAPSPIEMLISENKYIEQVCVVGNGLPQPIALVNLSENGKNENSQALIMDLKSNLSKVNARLDKHEKINNIVVMQEDWTVENKLLTPTMKIKRNSIEKLYSKKYQQWYSDEDILLMN